MVALRLVWGILPIVDKFKLHNVSDIRKLTRFRLELRTVKLEFHCFDTIIVMICVSNNNKKFQIYFTCCRGAHD